MIRVSLTTLANVLRAKLIGNSVCVDNVVIDSRVINKGDLFIAIRGNTFDGHDFVEQAKMAGAGALVVDHLLPIDLPQLVVDNTQLALGQLGAWVRQQITARVVALTGSSGKTSVKELCATILSQCGRILVTEGNLNNEIGVPLTLLKLKPEHDFAVIELGANHPGEIAYTAQLVQPEAVLVNNISSAHLAGFGSLSGVAKAKGEIFSYLSSTGTAIINNESCDWEIWHDMLKNKQVWRFSTEVQHEMDFYVTDVNINPDSSSFTLHSPIGSAPVYLPLLGKHNIANALAAAALTISVGAPLTAIQAGLKLVKPYFGRLNPIVLEKNKLILDDTYNANVGSMIAAIDTLERIAGYRVFVVGDMAELGEETIRCHQQVGQAVEKSSINTVLSVGQYSHYISCLAKHGEHFCDKQSLVARLKQLIQQYEVVTVLVKGSRSSAMDEVISIMQENK